MAIRLVNPSNPCDDSIIEATVRDLREMQRRGGLEMANAVGQLIIDRLYGGNLSAWRSRGPKDTSFRKLAARDDVPMSHSALCQSVAVYELSQRLEISPQNIGISHLRLLVGLPEEAQRRLAVEADHNGWPVTRMESEVRRIRTRSSSGGRPALPGFVKTIHSLRRFAADDGALFVEDIDLLESLEESDIQNLHETVAAVRAHCDSLEKLLGSRLPPAQN